MKFGNKLSKLRKEHNLSQEQLADKLEVSRQAVSKWESGQSYPEMDKIIILCKLFDCTIDELVNDKEVIGTDKTRRGFTNYIDEFLGFITKSFNMFWSMNFKQKISCIFQMGLLVLILLVIGIIFGNIINSCLNGVYSILPFRFESFIRSVFLFLYVIAGMVIGTLIVVHIFKIRFLDYFITIEDDDVTQKLVERPIDENKTIYKENKMERVVIRDPKHSTFHFFELLSKAFLIFLKGCALFVGAFFIFSFVVVAFMLGASLWYLKDGMIFFGFFIGLAGTIIINYVILEFIYRFIVNYKQSFKRMFIMGIISLLMIGIGLATSFVSYAGFKRVSVKTELTELNTNTRKIIHVEENQSIIFNCSKTNYCSKINYNVDESLNNVVIVDIKHNNNYNYELMDATGHDENNQISKYYHIYPYGNGDEFFDVYGMVIDDFKQKLARNYDYYPSSEVTIYATSSNIEKLKSNN